MEMVEGRDPMSVLWLQRVCISSVVVELISNRFQLLRGMCLQSSILELICLIVRSPSSAAKSEVTSHFAKKPPEP